MYPWQHQSSMYEHVLFQEFVEGQKATQRLAKVEKCIQSILNIRMRDPQQHQADANKNSKQGQKLIEEANRLKTKGNDAVKAKNYPSAIVFYTDALEKAYQVLDNNEQTGILLSNRCHASLQIGDLTNAAHDALSCMRTRPTWYKGALRVQQIFMAKQENKMAIEFGYEVVTEYDVPNAEISRIIREILVLADKIEGGYKPLYRMITTAPMWNSIMEGMARDGHWHVIHVLINGNDDIRPLMTDFKADGVKLSGLLGSISTKEWIDWGEKLVESLLQRGASHQSLDLQEKHPLHAALQIGIKTGTYGTLAHLFLHHIPRDDRNQTDDNGDTVLHIACRDSYPGKMKAITLILDNNVDPTKKNKAGKLAVELMSRTDSTYNVMLKALQNRGFNTSTLIECDDSSQKHGYKDVKWVGSDKFAITPYMAAPFNMRSSMFAHKKFAAKIWDVTEVKQWLEEKGLSFAKNRLSGLAGAELVELRLMQETAPDYFYETLLNNIQLTQIQILTFGSALRQLE